MIFLDIDRTLAGHVAVALARHRQALRREQAIAPEGLDELLDAMTRCAKAGQHGTLIDAAVDVAEYQPVTPMLLAKTEAAEALGMSDLEDYVASLAPVAESA